MKTDATRHDCRVGRAPWPGVHSVRTESERHFGRHWHDTFGIGVLEQGAQRSASGRGEVDAHAGELLAYNPGEVHDGRPLGGQARRWRMVHVERDLLAGAAGRPDIELAQPVIRDARLHADVRQLLDRLEAWQAARAATDVDLLACEESLARVLGRLLDAHASAVPVALEGASFQHVARVRERLADDLLAAPSLDELAALAQLGKYQLLRRFTRAYGLPPHAWLLQERVARARSAIRAGASLAQAAARSGFADQSHMTRAFTRQFGFTPGAWQRAMARAQ